VSHRLRRSELASLRLFLHQREGAALINFFIHREHLCVLILRSQHLFNILASGSVVLDKKVRRCLVSMNIVILLLPIAARIDCTFDPVVALEVMTF